MTGIKAAITCKGSEPVKAAATCHSVQSEGLQTTVNQKESTCHTVVARYQVYLLSVWHIAVGYNIAKYHQRNAGSENPVYTKHDLLPDLILKNVLARGQVHVSARSETAIYTTILKLHMSKTDMKLLRDELAESIGVIRRLSEQLQAADKRNAELEMLLAEYTMKYELAAAERDEALAKVERLEDTLQKVSEGKIEAEKALVYYDNAHAPPSNDTITQREINAEKKAERKKKNPTGRRGRKKGCKNTAISRKAERTARYTPEKYSECGGKNLRVTGAEGDMVYDIPHIPQDIMTNHIAETCTCADCDMETTEDTGMPKGTIFGPNLLKFVVSLWDGNGTDQKIADVFSGLFGVDKCAKSTIQHALDAAADRMEPEADRIAAEMVTKEIPVNIDETPFSACGSTGQAWLATDADATQVKVAGSRGAAVLVERFSVLPPAGYHRRAGGVQRVQDEAALLGAHTAVFGPAREGRQKEVRRVKRGVPQGGGEARQTAADIPRGETEGNRHRGGVRGVRGANRQAGGNVPQKDGRLPDSRRLVPVHVPAAREHGGHQQPGREGGAPHSGAPEDQRSDRQREGNAEDGHPVHVPAYLAQEEPQRLPRVGARPGAQVTIRTEPKRVR